MIRGRLVRPFFMVFAALLCAALAACSGKPILDAPSPVETAQVETQTEPSPPPIPQEMTADWAVSRIEAYQAAVSANLPPIDGEKDIMEGGGTPVYALVGMVQADNRDWWLQVRYSNVVDGHASRITDYFLLPDGNVREGEVRDDMAALYPEPTAAADETPPPKAVIVPFDTSYVDHILDIYADVPDMASIVGTPPHTVTIDGLSDGLTAEYALPGENDVTGDIEKELRKAGYERDAGGAYGRSSDGTFMTAEQNGGALTVRYAYDPAAENIGTGGGAYDGPLFEDYFSYPQNLYKDVVPDLAAPLGALPRKIIFGGDNNGLVYTFAVDDADAGLAALRMALLESGFVEHDLTFTNGAVVVRIERGAAAEIVVTLAYGA